MHTTVPNILSYHIREHLGPMGRMGKSEARLQDGQHTVDILACRAKAPSQPSLAQARYWAAEAPLGWYSDRKGLSLQK